MYWPKLTADKIKSEVILALNKNINYRKRPILGLPGTYLDPDIFYEDAPFLENAPFLSTLIANPNHIGCHTGGETDQIFEGTHDLERELIRICAEQIFEGGSDEQDGYVASGGTEANIEAVWIYRNHFVNKYAASVNEIGLIYSEDSHYSLSKAGNLLNIRSLVLKVDENSREIIFEHLEKMINAALDLGIKYFIVNLNLSTTMFGSVDDIDILTDYLNQRKLDYKLHVDAAFGGFIYPFTHPGSSFSFKNPNITSITMDAHKMMQTPYGTGIFLIRKGYIENVRTNEAEYVPGKDHTLSGSRSGANAVAVWMVLYNYGSEGWKTKMQSLSDRTTELCGRLNELGVEYFRNPCVNIVAIKSKYISRKLAEKYYLVGNKPAETVKWWKIVMMPHITRGIIDSFLTELKAEMLIKS
jgi:tyrosine decarboxylase/aspartate 1-decarboxylase